MSRCRGVPAADDVPPISLSSKRVHAMRTLENEMSATFTHEKKQVIIGRKIKVTIDTIPSVRTWRYIYGGKHTTPFLGRWRYETRYKCQLTKLAPCIFPYPHHMHCTSCRQTCSTEPSPPPPALAPQIRNITWDAITFSPVEVPVSCGGVNFKGGMGKMYHAHATLKDMEKEPAQA